MRQVLIAFTRRNDGQIPALEQQSYHEITTAPDVKIVEIPQGHHYCFIEQEELVYEEMRKFLSD